MLWTPGLILFRLDLCYPIPVLCLFIFRWFHCLAEMTCIRNNGCIIKCSGPSFMAPHWNQSDGSFNFLIMTKTWSLSLRCLFSLCSLCNKYYDFLRLDKFLQPYGPYGREEEVIRFGSWSKLWFYAQGASDFMRKILSSWEEQERSRSLVYMNIFVASPLYMGIFYVKLQKCPCI
jgi:hypothetical protein